MDASSDMVITTRRNILPVISVCVTTVNPTDVSSCNVPNPVVNRTNVSLERVANISVQKVCVFSFSYFLFWQALKKKKFPNIKKIIQIVRCIGDGLPPSNLLKLGCANVYHFPIYQLIYCDCNAFLIGIDCF